MKRYLPLNVEGRNVYLHKIRRLKYSRNPLKPGQNRVIRAIRDTILDKEGDGKWYSLTRTRSHNPDYVGKLAHAVRQALYWRGYSAAQITLVATTGDGLCFRWEYDPTGMLHDPALRAKRLELRKKGEKKKGTTA